MTGVPAKRCDTRAVTKPAGHRSNQGSMLPVECGRLQKCRRAAHAASPKSKTNNVLADSSQNLGHPYPGISREEKLCFLCPVGLKEENLFTKAWKYFITSSRGRSVLMTWSTGLWLAAGFLKLQRAHWSACQPLGQQWDETDKIIVSNEIQISRSVWTGTCWALFSLSSFFFFFEGGAPYWSWIWRETVEVGSLIQTRAGAPALVELWYCLKFCKRTRHRQPAGPCCHDNPNYLPLQPSFYTGREPLCSLGICISLGQVLKVREMNQNNT